MRGKITSISIVLLLASPVFAGQIVRWGVYPPDYNDMICPVWVDTNDYVDIGGGPQHRLAIKADGSLMVWNAPYSMDVPDGNNYIKVVGGREHSVALKSDGSVVAWGGNYHGQSDEPAGNDYVDIAAGSVTSIALTTDGSLVVWGYQFEDRPSGNGFVGVAVGEGVRVAIKSDGSLVAWGQNIYGSGDVPDGNDFVKVAAGSYHGTALRSDGSLAGWGWNDEGQATPPPGNDYVDIFCGWYHSLAIKEDGTMVGWGRGICGPPEGTDYVKGAVGDEYRMALTGHEKRYLTIQTSPENITCVSPPKGQHEYYFGQRVIVQASRCPACPDVYDFVSWSGDVNDSNSAIFMVMDANYTITGAFTPDERVCGDECHPILQGDLNEDCYINFDDFSIYAENWLNCTAPECD